MEASRKIAKDLLQDESGQNLIEYALVAALLGVGCLTAMTNLASKVGSAFTSIGSTLTSNV